MRLLLHTGTRLARCAVLALAPLAIMFLAASALAAPGAGTAGPAALVRDINTTTPTFNSGSAPKYFANLGGITLFAAHDEFDGIELWKTDGTPTGTVMVKDIFPGVSGSTPAYLSAFNGFVYFQASDGSYGFELWRSDGTAEGTTLVKDIRPGPGYSSPYQLTAVGNTLYFVADDGAHGYELWKSDGTPEGTALVRDIFTGTNCSVAPCGSFPAELTAFGALLFFQADDGEHGVELWKTDGTPSGTVMVKDICASGPACRSNPAEFTAYGGLLYFRAADADGNELWKTDGTMTGTVRVKDICTGSPACSSDPAEFAVYHDALFFRAAGADGAELWKSNGTETGTVQVKDIFTGTTGSYPSDLVVTPNGLLFVADDGARGRELWLTNGESAGTVLFADIYPGATGSAATFLVPAGGEVYLLASGDDATGRELWATDATPGGTHLVMDIYPGLCPSRIPGNPPYPCSAFFDPPVDFTVYLAARPGGGLIFRASDGQHGHELWRTGGSEAGTQLVKDIRPQLTDTYPASLTPAGDALYFVAGYPGLGYELWRSDGAPTGTQVVSDIAPGLGSSSPADLTDVNGVLFFAADDGIHGRELWRSDGTPHGTRLVRDIFTGACYTMPCSGSPQSLLNFGGVLIFNAVDAERGYELWRSDGTEAGTSLLADILPGPDSSGAAPLAASNGMVLLTAYDPMHGRELWKTAGDAAATALVSDIRPGAESSDIAWPVVMSGTLFFRADDGVHGRELWASDGTVTGTRLVKDILPGAVSSDLVELTAAGGRLFFFADDGIHGVELWASDGTEAGTHLVKDLYPGPDGSGMFGNEIAGAGGLAYLRATDGAHGMELWRSDGTEAGTAMVKDIVTGMYGSFPQSITAAGIGRQVLFSASDGVHGSELWQSDGTPEGTRMIQDIAPGAPSSQPYRFVAAGSSVFFLANDAATGVELWATPIGGTKAYLPVAHNAPPVSDPELKVYAGQITIPTYDWPKGLYPSSPSDPIYPYPYIHQDWQYYAAPRTYDVIVLENSHVRVTVLPEIGGRVIRWQDKHTGRLLTYANPVIKPAMRWGYRGWWLGAGGLEWAFPVDEHGLNEYRSWQAEMLSGDGWRGVRVSDVESRTGLAVSVTLRLYAGRSDLEIAPSITNGTGQTRSFQFWINAMLTLSGENAPSGALRFWIPTSQMKVHSTSDPSLPPPRGLMSWPVYNGRDFSRYPAWSRYLGVFATEANGAAGAYDETADQGIVRSYPPAIAKGVKLFNLGEIGSAQYTDDSSRYFELWGGYNRTFFPEDYAPIADGQTIAWTERWYPVSGIGGLSWADAGLAAFVRATPGGVAVGLGAPAAAQARLVLRQNGETRATWDAAVGPGVPFQAVYPGGGSGWELEVWRGGAPAARIPAAPWP